MNLKENIKLDTHTHTIASGHAFSSILEMKNAAEKKGLELLCITEHGPSMLGGPHPFYFSNLGIMNYPNLIFGIEANIIDFNGHLDYEDIVFKNNGLDLVIASFHTVCLNSGTIQQNTNAYIKAIEKKFVNIVGHIDDGNIPCNYEEIILAAKENKVIVELNNSSLNKTSFRKNSLENAYKYIQLCKDNNVPICLSSDAHYEKEVGDFSNLYQILQDIKFPNELVLNTNTNLFLTFLNNR